MTAEIVDLSPPSKVLIIKPSSLGDVITAIPVLRGLKRTFPSARIGWLMSDKYSSLLDGDSDLDEIIIFKRNLLGKAGYSPKATAELMRLVHGLRSRRFDWVLDLQGLLRSGLLSFLSGAPVRAGFADAREAAPWFYTHRITVSETHTVERNIALGRQLGVDIREGDFKLHIPTKLSEYADRFKQANGLADRSYLACIAPTRWPNKLYPIRHWRKIIQALLNDTQIVLLGAPGDEGLCHEIASDMPPGVVNLAGKTSIQEMVAVIASSAGVICSDSAANFIAPAVGVDAVVLIGPTRVERTGPYGGGSALIAPVACQGCLKRQCLHITCMQSISPAMVIDAARQILTQERRN